MGFGAANHDAVIPLSPPPAGTCPCLPDPWGLWNGRPSYVGDTGVAGQIVFLNIFQKFLEIFVVVGSVFLVDIVTDDGQGGETVETSAPLVTGAYVISQISVDLDPRHQVFLGGRG
jgi:hypothetical protein